MLAEASALLAYRRGDYSDEAFYGACLEADFMAHVVEFVRGWSKATPKTKRRKRS